MPEISDFEVGQTVEVGDGQVGVVQFVGSTHFAPGDWVGIVFDEPLGKNDGSVQGQRYFDCPTAHGMFVRPAVAKVVEQPNPKPVRLDGKANSTSTKGRLSVAGPIGLKKSVGDSSSAKRQSINAGSPTPSTRLSRLNGSSKSPTKQLGSNGASITSTTRTNTPTNTARKSIAPSLSKSRTSMGPPPLPSTTRRPIRPSVNASINRNPQTSGRTSSVSEKLANRLSGNSEGTGPQSRSGGSERGKDGELGSQSETAENEARLVLNSEIDQDATAMNAKVSVETQDDANTPTGVQPFHGRIQSTVSGTQRAIQAATSLKRENEDLNTKLRLGEKKRAEDREKLKDLEKVQAERDRFEGIIQKLQAKYQPQQQELADLKKYTKEAEARIEVLESQQAESESLNEMTTLDKEMAEELAETAKLELQTLRRKQEELELEVEVLREENQELGKEISPEEKTSQGWLQLERSNERYRDALLRLRDVTQEQEADLRAQLEDLEKELGDFTKLKEDAASMKDELAKSEANIEDLRQQLDTALGAEDMIEELTQKNLILNEKMDELKSTIEDLESLKELNDELEINHTENEKQLQDEIDFQETLLAEEARKAAVQEGNVQDLEYTISRFRDLVTTLQNDLEDMKASQQISETQANELNARSRAIEDLNLKLQTSAARAQAKALDIELNRLRAQESAEHLAIVQLFLPESFKSEKDSVQALLRFRRLEFKTRMLYGFIKERTNDVLPGQEQDVIGHCSMMDCLMWIATTSDRFVKALETCSLETFKRLGAASFDLEPLERAIDRWVVDFKNDEIKTSQCASELSSYITVMKHLVEVHVSETSEHYADLIHHKVSVMQARLESTALVLLNVKSLSESKADELYTDTLDIEEDLQSVLHKLDAVLSQSRSIKVVSQKNLRQLGDLKSRSMTLDSSTAPMVEQAEQSVADLAALAQEFGLKIFNSLNDVDQGKISSAQELATLMQTGPASLPSLSSKAYSAASHTQTLNNLATSLAQIVEFSPLSNVPPWKILAQNVHAANADLCARESQIDQLKVELAEKNTTLAMKEKATEEMSVKLETLERRLGETSANRERIRELESVLENVKAKEKDLLGKLGHLKNEYQILDNEREKWRRTTQTTNPALQQTQVSSAAAADAIAVETSIRRIEPLQNEIKNLQSCIRYLQNAAHKQNSADSLEFLSQPITSKVMLSQTTAHLEAQDILKEMLHVIAHKDNQVVALKQRPSSGRLRWRPSRETALWQVQRQKEEWEEWREWRDDVANQTSHLREKRKASGAKAPRGQIAKTPLASLQISLPEKPVSGGEVKISNIGEWEAIERALGVRDR